MLRLFIVPFPANLLAYYDCLISLVPGWGCGLAKPNAAGRQLNRRGAPMDDAKQQ